ncbi:carnosine n-methyltransferase [Anaeramoeba flamelloides]|uniref:carnosine N-methyltransferase n=1 Tax=Anaeramoeba flamelloides TaxID=1746091 RepID=A0ABQ8XDD1_9EUKA|nr:carnosine n-methyltransferase [Anaeramoeba flamelloides]
MNQGNEEEQLQQIELFNKTLATYLEYERFTMNSLQKEQNTISGLYLKYGKYLDEKQILTKFKRLNEAVEKNSHFLHTVVASQLYATNQTETNFQKLFQEIVQQFSITEYNISRVRTIIKMVVRDWSSEGLEERKSSYGVIKKYLLEALPDLEDRKKFSILVPGSGMGRLAFDLVREGFQTEGNEFSYLLLIMSNFLLNSGLAVKELPIFPYVSDTDNILKIEDRLQEIKIPDTNTFEIPKDSKFSMSGGDFVDVYRKEEYKNTYDCVVSCFFLDTAHNILEYLEIIKNILKVGGVLINFGPLTYHWSGMNNEVSIELSLQEINEILIKMGFEFLIDEIKSTSYSNNQKSMHHTNYDCAFFVCKKTSK